MIGIIKKVFKRKNLKVYPLYTIHAEVIRDAISKQIDSIEKQLSEQEHIIVNKEKTRLKQCLISRHELPASISRILNSGAGIIRFDPTPHDYYSSPPTWEQ
jgi:DNA recombination-dependent growth factor C